MQDTAGVQEENSAGAAEVAALGDGCGESLHLYRREALTKPSQDGSTSPGSSRGSQELPGEVGPRRSQAREHGNVKRVCPISESTHEFLVMELFLYKQHSGQRLNRKLRQFRRSKQISTTKKKACSILCEYVWTYPRSARGL